MKFIAKHPNEIQFIYTSNKIMHKKALGYIKVSDKKLNVKDLCNQNVTPNQWLEILELLNREPSDIIDKEGFKKTYPSIESDNITKMSWLKILSNTPNFLKYPILINGERANLVKNTTNILQYLSSNSKETSKY